MKYGGWRIFGIFVDLSLLYLLGDCVDYVCILLDILVEMSVRVLS